jgi:hypothetical protein
MVGVHFYRCDPLSQPIHFNCQDCGTRYLAVRTESSTERAYRLYCQVCRQLLHADTGSYCLSELVMIVDSGGRAEIARYRQEAERCLALAARARDLAERETLQLIADEWLRLAQATRD